MVRRIPIGPLAGLVAVPALLAALDAAVGLGRSGWLVGLACAVVTSLALARGLVRRDALPLGPADRVTLVRTVFACGVAALVADSFARAAPTPMVVALAVLALVLDAVDGRVARRTGTVSALGARFDLEVDAFLVLALSVYVAGLVGWWVLAIGSARYLLLAAGWWLPWLRGQVVARRWRKVVAAIQGIVLTVAAAEVLPPAWTVAALLGALALLALSFGSEVRSLWRGRASQPPGAQPPPEPGAQPPPEPPRPEPPGSEEHPVRATLLTLVAAALVWAAAVLPASLTEVSPAALARIPLEVVLVAGLLLVLPGRARRWLATTVGALLGLLVLVRLLDLGFHAALYRSFNPVTDWSYLGSTRDLLADSTGPALADVALVGLGLLLLGLPAVLAWALRRIARLLQRHRPRATVAVTGLAVAWVGCAFVGLHLAAGVPVASSSTAALAGAEASMVRANLDDRAIFSRAIRADPHRTSLGSDLLTALRGKDVVVVFVESYGEVATSIPQVSAALEAGMTQLDAAGYRSRSAWLTSPTFGGISWLAHATLQSGLWVNSQQRYDQLLDSDRVTLSAAFAKAGWRTVGIDPANGRDWPEGSSFYRYDQLYDARNVGYAGPRFGYAPVPDQFTLAAFDRLELRRPGRGPVMAEINLVSSHVPWAPLPRLVEWGTVGDGSGYAAQHAAATSRDDVWRTAAGVRTAYAESIAYSLESIVSFVRNSHDDDLVLIVLGDHQPATVVSGPDAGHDVPVSIISHDQRVLDRISGWDWQAGLRPSRTAPVWPMNQFRDRFLAAYGPGRPDERQSTATPTSELNQ